MLADPATGFAAADSSIISISAAPSPLPRALLCPKGSHLRGGLLCCRVGRVSSAGSDGWCSSTRSEAETLTDLGEDAAGESPMSAISASNAQNPNSFTRPTLQRNRSREVSCLTQATAAVQLLCSQLQNATASAVTGPRIYLHGDESGPILRATWGAAKPPPAAPTADATTAPPAVVARKPLTPVATAAEPPARPIAAPTPAAIAGAAMPPAQAQSGGHTEQLDGTDIGESCITLWCQL